MPLSYDVSDDLLRVVASGAYTFEEIKRSFEEAIQSLPSDRSIPVLVDARSSDYVPSSEELQRVSSFAASLLPRIEGRIALVVSGNVRFGLGRMLEVFGESEGVVFKVFRDMEEARRWVLRTGNDTGFDPA